MTRRNPRTFTSRGERMYEHIKAGYGKDPRAAEIAARTVYARSKDVPGLLRANGIAGPAWRMYFDRGWGDCDNVIDLDDFREDAPAPDVVDRVFARYEDEGLREQWIEQARSADQVDDPDAAYLAWSEGWKACAVKNLIRWRANRQHRDEEP